MRTTILFIMVTFACACSRRLIPADEATPNERAKIEQTIAEIESLLREYGNTTNVRTLPVLVRTDNADLMDRYGYCAKLDGKRSLYIALNRDLFEREIKDPQFHRVFSVLLHEFGHCYFSRQHDQRLVQVYGRMFPVSIMYQKQNGEGASPFFSTQQFQNYYVGELIGARTVDSLNDYLNLFTISLK